MKGAVYAGGLEQARAWRVRCKCQCAAANNCRVRCHRRVTRQDLIPAHPPPLARLRRDYLVLWNSEALVRIGP